MKVWNLIFSYTDYDQPCESYVRVKTFSSVDGAKNALEKDFDETLKGLEADGVLDIVTKVNYGDTALLCTGVVCEDNPDLDEISYRFSWRVSMTTIDFHTIEDRIVQINDIDDLTASLEDDEDICKGEDLIRVECLGKVGDELIADFIVEHMDFPYDLRWVRSDEASNVAWFKLED